jgi:hypothetical protein
VRLVEREASASRVAKWHKKSAGFNKNIKKSGTLIMGDRGLVLVLVLALIVLLVIEDI